VAVVGAPNAGKSTLTNALVGRLVRFSRGWQPGHARALRRAHTPPQVTAVSKKTNTTRAEALGALTVGDTQLLLYDTPGAPPFSRTHTHTSGSPPSQAWWRRRGGTGTRTRRGSPARGVQPQPPTWCCSWWTRTDRRAAQRARDDHARRDALTLRAVASCAQVTAPDPRVPALFARAAQELLAAASRGGGADGGSYVPPHSLLVLNKADALPGASRRPALRRLLDDLAPLHDFSAAFGISALQRSGVAALTAHLLALGKAARWPLPPERATDRGPAAQALAATQGALFERLHAEVPYHVSLRHVSWEDFRDGSARVEQVLLVPSDAVRKIVVGSGGAAIGQIGIAARKACERLFGRRVHLILRVKVARGRRAALAEGPDAALDTEGIVAEQSERMP